MSGSLLILRASTSISATSGGTRRQVDLAERLVGGVAARDARARPGARSSRPRRSTRRSGTLTKPNSSSVTCASSISDGCSGCAFSMNGRASLASTSSATVTTSTPCGSNARAAVCHSGQVEAAAAPGGPRDQHTFWPRRLESLNGLPSASGSSSSGATAEVSARPVTAVSGPSAQMPCASSATSGMPSRSARIRTSRRPSASRTPARERNAHFGLARALGLDRPAGRLAKSCSSTFRSCRITAAR